MIILVLSLGLAACSSSDKTEIEKVPDKSAQALFTDAREALDSGLYQRAIQILSAMPSMSMSEIQYDRAFQTW